MTATESCESPKRTRRWRFSLQSGLLFITTICVLLGWVLHEVHARNRREELVRQLESQGFGIHQQRIKPTNPFSAASWLDFIDERYCLHVIQVQIGGTNVATQSDLEIVCRLPHLAHLSIPDASLTQDSMNTICRCQSIETLSLGGAIIAPRSLAKLHNLRLLEDLKLYGSNISDEEMIHLRPLERLTKLSLRGTSIGDQGLAHLAGLTNLQRLDLSETQITDDGLAQLVNLTSLEELWIDGTRVTDKGLTTLLKRLPKLTVSIHGPNSMVEYPSIQTSKVPSLRLGDPFASDATLEWLSSATELQELYLEKASVTDQGMRHLHSLHKLEILDIRQTALTSRGLEWLAGLPLKTLWVGEQIDDVGVRQISRIATLEELSVSGPLITDAGINCLRELPNLRRLGLYADKVRGDGFECLSSLDKLEVLALDIMSFTEVAARHIAQAPNLKSLYLSGVNLEPHAIGALAGAAKLEEISFYETQIDERCLAELPTIGSLRVIRFQSENISLDNAKRLRAARRDCRIYTNRFGEIP